MPTPFAALDDRLNAAVDAAFGVRLRHVPCLSPSQYGNAGLDPERPVRDVVGQLADGLAAGDRDDEALRRAGKRDPIARDIVLSVAAAQWPTPAHLPRAPDRLVLLDDPAEPVFEVVAAAPSGGGRLHLDLVQGRLP